MEALALSGDTRAVRREFEHWLSKRAAAGDQTAFAVLVEHIWREIQRGHYNPHRASFVSFASMVAHEAMLADHRRRRRKMRWTAEPPMSVEYLHEAEIELQAPSWHFGADPLAVVLERESLRLAWQALSARHVAAVEHYLATDGVGAPKPMVTAFYEARKRVRPILA